MFGCDLVAEFVYCLPLLVAPIVLALLVRRVDADRDDTEGDE